MFFEEYNDEDFFEDEMSSDIPEFFISARIGFTTQGLAVYSLKKMVDLTTTPDFDRYDAEEFVLRLHGKKENAVILKDN
jgi:hypothetical protein